VVETVLMWLGYGLCHQLPERSLFGGAYQVPVCARDEGIYLGFVASFIVVALLARGRRPSEGPRLWLTAVGIVLISLMVFDGVTSYAGLRVTDNEIRLATGIFAGYAIALFILPLLNGQLWRVQDRTRPLERPWQVLVWLTTMPVLYAATWWAFPLLDLAYPIIVALAILTTFVIVNLVIVGLFRTFENRAERPRDLLVPILIAFAMTMTELAGSAAFKAWLEGVVSQLSRSS